MPESQLKPSFNFKEDEYLQELYNYICSTYEQHYGKEEIQASEFISDSGHGTGFFMGSILKYAKRYGKKGDNVAARKDIMKIAHYAILQLYEHDKNEKNF